MQSLFDEIKNPLFSLMCRLVNEIHDGKKLTRQEIKNRIRNLPDFFITRHRILNAKKKLLTRFFILTKKINLQKIISTRKFLRRLQTRN